MKGLKAGGKALVIGAASAYGRITLVGKVVTLVERYTGELPQELLKPGFRWLHVYGPLWKVHRDGWMQPEGRRHKYVDPTDCFLDEKYLIPLDDEDLELEIASEMELVY